MSSRGTLLFGQIRSQSLYDSDGWARREIMIQLRDDGFPELRTKIKILDCDENVYSVKCIKGANKKGYGLLGSPREMLGWFEKRFDKETVFPAKVYFEVVSESFMAATFRLYSDQEWQNRV